MKLSIIHLYGDLMNTYGDDGNILVLKRRCEWRGIEVEVKNISIGDGLKPNSGDLFFFGGGQDQSQIDVGNDLVKTDKAEVLKKVIEKGVPLLSICGGYQLLGEYYLPHDGEKIPGADILPVYTKASYDRMIGNLIVDTKDFPHNVILAPSRIQNAHDPGQVHSDPIGIGARMTKIKPQVTSLRGTKQSQEFLDSGQAGMTNSSVSSRATRGDLIGNQLVGFENHSGKTYLKEGAQPLGRVLKGFGNNGEDKTEGCIYNNAIGCYLHGSLLPKNPQLADWLITQALIVKYQQQIQLQPLDDTLEQTAHNQVIGLYQ